MRTALERLGRVGIWSGAVPSLPAPQLRESLAEVETLGYPSIWFGEAFSRESFSASALVLSSTEKLVAATGITNVYARDPAGANAGAKSIGEAFPGRFVLGLGISHSFLVEMRGQTYGPPVATMRAYLDGMEAAPYQGPEPAGRVPVVLAALGPKMLDLSRDRTDGAHPYFVPVEHTAQARERLGPGKLLAPEQAVILTDDESLARELAREHCAF
jgi:probable F420-dependent oxidoreductase